MSTKVAKTVKTDQQNRHGFLFYLLYVSKKIFEVNSLYSVLFIVLAFLTVFLPQVESYALGRLIDTSISAVTSGSSSQAFLIILIAFGVVLLVSKIIFDFYNFVSSVSDMKNRDACDYLYGYAILNAKPRDFEDTKFMRLKNTYEYNSWKIQNVIRSTIVVITSFFAAVSIIVIFLNYDVKIVLLVILSLVVPIAINLKFGKQVWSIWSISSDEKVIYSKYRHILHNDNAQKFAEIKTFGFGPYLVRRARELNEKFSAKLIANEKRRLGFIILSRFWEFAFTILGLYFVFQLLVLGRVSIGQFFFIVTLFQSMKSTTAFAVEELSTLLSDGPLLRTFYDFINYNPSEVNESSKLKVNANDGITIEFKNVNFTYPNTTNKVLDTINIVIPAKKDIALVGQNGAGKTTLIKLLLRIYDPTEGEILINGTNLKELDLADYYKKIGLLSQDFVKFGFQVWENIFVGNSDVPPNMSEIISAAKKARADEFINLFTNKYDTYLAPDIAGGADPSGGQWQRLAISRVFYRNPSLIVLDEPTSAIDSLAEEEIFSNIKDFAKEKTVIMVSHRFATVKKADYIFVLSDGRVVEEGTHTELSKKDGLYSNMYNAQTA